MIAARLPNRKASDVLLHRMAKAGEIERVKRGVYSLLRTRTNAVAQDTRKIGKKERSHT